VVLHTFLVASRCDDWVIAAAGNQKVLKPEAAITVFELLMMGDVSPETCWAIKEHWNNKFYYTDASCWFFLWGSIQRVCINFRGWNTLAIFSWIFPSLKKRPPSSLETLRTSHFVTEINSRKMLMISFLEAEIRRNVGVYSEVLQRIQNSFCHLFITVRVKLVENLLQ
jgi:hypothetical protein